ncbi:MAG TPA: hypothetical protein VIP11_27630 [Gemmatimonadaceae bacterium]
MTARIALATYERAPELAPDDHALVPALSARGIEACPVVWSDPAVDWSRFDAVVLRSCWDYHLRFAEFRGWLDRLESANARVMNSTSLVRWNADKRYLIDLARRGIATIPTMVVARGLHGDVDQVAAAEGWSRIVVKPTVSASGYETHAFDAPLDATSRELVGRVTSVGDVLVQPFAHEVPRNGEYSFVFIDGEFTHAAIKRAGGSEFRVQIEHGGSVAAVTAPPELIEQAHRVLEVLDETPVYARVDGIARGSAFLLMELELIEPNLFFEHGPGSAEKMAAAIERRIR